MNNPEANNADSEILLRLKRGDETAFKIIYEQHWKYLYQKSFNVLQNESDCLDICQNVFLWLWENRQTIELHTNLRAYLYGAVKFKVANLIKRGRAKLIYLDDLPVAEGLYDENHLLEVKELKQIIYQAIDNLPGKCREVFKLSRFDHLSHKEIALRMKISEKTVDDHISRAIQRLKKPLSRLSTFLTSFI